MSAKDRKQLVIMHVLEGRIPFIPKGSYKMYIDDVVIVDGSIKVKARILTSAILHPEAIREEVKKDG